MKKIHILIAFIFIIMASSCEEVIPVDLSTDPPRLVIEASIKWQKGTTGNDQMIKLSTTSSYFSNIIPAVSGAKITVKNSQNKIFDFTEGSTAGQYNCSNFEPKIDETYTLTLVVNGNTYTATETLKSVAPIEEIIQNDNGGITANRIQLKSYFTDPANQNNFYLFNYSYKDKIAQDYFTDDDVSFQGNKFFSLSRNADIKKGDLVTITQYGISEQYFNYMKVLISIAGARGGGPFQAPPVTVRGNVLNTTNKDDYPLGYFFVGEMDTKNFTIQ